MTIIYKVWVSLERQDDEDETITEYEDIGEPIDLGEFDTEEEAQDFIASLPTK